MIIKGKKSAWTLNVICYRDNQNHKITDISFQVEQAISLFKFLKV